MTTAKHGIELLWDPSLNKSTAFTEEEKQALESKAAEVAGGADHVKSEIEVKASGRNNSQ